MHSNFANYITASPWGRILRVLTLSPRPRCIRELAEICELSTSGTKDALDRFTAAKLSVRRKVGNKILFSLNTSAEEFVLLHKLFELQTNAELRRRATRYSQHYDSAIAWIDETQGLYADASASRVRT